MEIVGVETAVGRVLSHAAFRAMVNRLAGAFRDPGVGKGNRVAIFLPNSPAFLTTYCAAARIGALATQFNIMLCGPETRYILNNFQARLLVAAWVSAMATKLRMPTREQNPNCR